VDSLRVAAADGESPARLSAAERETVGLISLSHGLQHVYLGVLPFLYPFMVTDLHLSYTALGVLLGVAGVAGGVLQGAAGLYERVSPRLALSAQNVLIAATLAGIAVSSTFAALGASRLAGAIVDSPQHPVGNAVLARRFPGRCATVLSWHAIGANLGTLSVPLIAAALIAAAGWRLTALVFTAPIALGGLLLALRLREPRSGAGGPRYEAGAARRAILSRGALTLIAVATVGAGAGGLGVLTAFLPTYLYTGLGLAPLTGGLVATVFVAGGIIGPICAGMVADRLGRRRLVFLIFVGGAVALACVRLAGAHVPALLVLSGIAGVLTYSTSPLLEALFSDAVRGASLQAAFGVYLAVSYGAGSLWVGGLGWVIDHFGVASMLTPIAASLAVAGLLVLTAPRLGGR
jgi:FSR family fosmidomycin resistance protein-like MFS transporter